jgi:hypothetical protein
VAGVLRRGEAGAVKGCETDAFAGHFRDLVIWCVLCDAVFCDVLCEAEGWLRCC